MAETNAALVKRYLAEDPGAFAMIVARYQSAVFGLCLKMLGHRQDAEDAVQETFSRLARSLHRWDPQRPLEPWLMAIAGNRCRTALARRRRVSVSLEEAGDPVCRPADSAPSGMAEEIERAVATLRREHRQALHLFHREQLSYEQIAEQMNRPLGTIKTWVHRARAQVLDELRKRDALEGTRRAV